MKLFFDVCLIICLSLLVYFTFRMQKNIPLFFMGIGICEFVSFCLSISKFRNLRAHFISLAKDYGNLSEYKFFDRFNPRAQIEDISEGGVKLLRSYEEFVHKDYKSLYSLMVRFELIEAMPAEKTQTV